MYIINTCINTIYVISNVKGVNSENVLLKKVLMNRSIPFYSVLH